ncbi:MAG: response regulator [Defluviitaleaceae bacterium]|nr:response regulator [Defluviitaleaceae bacterium]
MNAILSAEDKSKILDALPGMAFQCLYDPPNFPFIYASEGCEALTGYTANEFVAKNGIRLMDIVHFADVEKLKAQQEDTLSIGAPLESAFNIKAKDGTQKYVLLRSRVSKTNEVGMPHIIEGLFTDITKQIRMESARQNNQDSTEFWAKMGHGVRTPMNAILGLTELGLRGDMPETVREYTQTIKKAGEHLMSVFNHIMDYKKLSQGEMEIIPEAYSLLSLVNDVTNITLSQMQNTGLEFVIYVDSTIPNVLIGDMARIRQILLNVLSNAIKFTDKGYVSLSIDGAVQNGTTSLVITIEDTGRGIKEEDIGLLFKEFSQFDVKNIEGGGVGLVIVKNLLDLMSGEIEVSSMYGVGSVFTITIPQYNDTSLKAPAVKVNNAEALSVLIFERRKANKASLVRTLKNLGIQNEAVATTEDFHAAITGNQYSFIFADNTLYEQFKLSYPDYKPASKIVLMAEYGETGTFNDTMAILSKPIFYLPVVDILNETKSHKYTLRGGETARFTAPKARVLIVDDIVSNLMVASGLLQPYKMRVDLCETGMKAVEMAKNNRYDLILMDYLMPVMDGIECARLIRSNGYTKPIVALTANTGHSSKELFRRNGFDDFLPKPIEMMKLASVMETWIPKDKWEKAPEAEAITVPKPEFEIQGIDVKKGIAGTGGKLDIYLRVMSKYLEDGRRLLHELGECLENGNINLYRIRIHALSSLSASIGAVKMAKAAKGLELAVEEGDIEFIQKRNPEFLRDFEILLENIRPIVAKKEYDQPMSLVENKKNRVLIVDDTEAYLLILNDILKDEYETIIVMDGEDGLETARLTSPDIILLDIVMLGMSGYDVLKELKADKQLKSIPVILISGKASAQYEEKGYSLGAASYIRKPFNKEEVLQKIKSILGGN